MVKNQIRIEFITRRHGLSGEELIDATENIVNNFRLLALQGVQVLLSYYPIPERKEMNVTLCEQLMLLENPQLQIALPKMSDDGFTMNAITVTKETTLVKNRYDILEPAGSDPIDPQLIDAVFVPLIAFDKKGYRVGYGKGYYDRFLSKCAEDVVKIGFSYFEAVDRIDDINEFDVPLNYCITPMRVYEF